MVETPSKQKRDAPPLLIEPYRPALCVPSERRRPRCKPCPQALRLGPRPSTAILADLAIVEVALRNALHNALTNTYGPEWYQNIAPMTAY